MPTVGMTGLRAKLSVKLQPPEPALMMSTPLLGPASIEPPSVLAVLLPEPQATATQSRHPLRLKGSKTRPISDPSKFSRLFVRCRLNPLSH